MAASESLVDRLLRFVRGGPEAPGDRVLAQLAETRAALDEARAERDDLQRRLGDADERIEKLRAEKAEAKRSAAERRAEAMRQRRRAPVSRVLQDLMTARRAQLPLRASAAGAPLREQRLLQVSASYADAIAGRTPPDPDLAQRIELDGLAWWVPVGSSAPEEVARAVSKEALPYLALLQSREVCVGGIMLDLGAHDGGTAIPRVLLGDVEAVYCAEPDPLNYACLAANVCENSLRGLVLPDRVAIGASEGKGRLHLMRSTRGHRVIASDTDEDSSAVVEVEIRTLDAWVSDLQIDQRAISFIKSDTQGYELQVLEGAPAVLAQRQIAWQLEVAPALMRVAGSDLRDFVAMLSSRFTHFIDLRADAPGKRRRVIADLGEGLAYLEREGESAKTDLIVYSAGAVAR